MSHLSATELANTLKLSKGRISQYLSEGKLEGCYQGEGRARRFDLDKVASALGRKLDKGQMLGNGLETRRAIRALQAEKPEEPATPRPESRLPLTDPDELELVKLAKANEELRRLRRDNAVADGAYVLASEVERETTKAIRAEIAGFETLLRDGARAIADQLGVDFKAARRILTDLFRAHRSGRVEQMVGEVAIAVLTGTEAEADI